jgi:hypothetical protein
MILLTTATAAVAVAVAHEQPEEGPAGPAQLRKRRCDMDPEE